MAFACSPVDAAVSSPTMGHAAGGAGQGGVGNLETAVAPATGGSGQGSGGEPRAGAAGGVGGLVDSGAQGGGGIGGGGIGGTDGGNAGSGGISPRVDPSCAASPHPVCLDFEAGKLPSDFQAPDTPNFGIEQGRAAHGQYAMHVSDLRSKPKALVTTTALGSIKDVVWGRYYLYLSTGAPWGHGAMVWVGDALEPTNWYEVGFESSSYFGMWIRGEGWVEDYMRSEQLIPGDRWLCVEFMFDGATPSLGRYWAGLR